MTKTANKVTKMVIYLLTVVVLVVSFAGIKASASWYGWTYATFSVGVTGAEHYYDGNNVGLNWGSSTHNSNPNHINNSGGVTVTL